MTCIVVVDDDRDFTDLVTSLLEDRGWRAATCHVEWDAAACVKREQPDAVLLDLRMGSPKSGWTILDQMRADPATSRIPVIVCSASAAELRDKNGELQARNVGALVKPFEIDELYCAIEHSLRTSV